MPHPHREDGFNTHAKKEKVRREDKEHHSQESGFDHHGTNHLTHRCKPAIALEEFTHFLKKLEDSVVELFYQDNPTYSILKTSFIMKKEKV
uniref:Paired amphipathic helix protein Sin3-like 3 n=1 Tax=Tanacetum cinerariifolium TaxID=118510 RepID=A0A699H9R8_TANCI|nr:paired amphipathic helix protein Sin3-like 3 [Tanacetum cinerariifolium]